MSNTILMALIGASGWVTELQSQTPSVNVGDRVRVSTQCTVVPTATDATREVCLTNVGTLVQLSAQELLLQTTNAGSPLQLSMSSVFQLEVSKRRGKFWTPIAGGFMGLVVGAGVGAFLGSLSSAGGDASEAALYNGIFFGGIGGTLLGIVGGAAVGKERWEDVPLATISSALVSSGVLVRRYAVRFRIPYP